MEQGHDIDDELPEAVDCPCCGGEGAHLGTLGNLEHFRCRQCGAGDVWGIAGNIIGEKAREATTRRRPNYRTTKRPKPHTRSKETMSNRRCYYIPVDGYVEGEGYRVAVVVENEAGYRPTGTWPYTGKAGETRPYFWGHDYDVACDIAREQNKALGLTEEDVTLIVASSMGAQKRNPKVQA